MNSSSAQSTLKKFENLRSINTPQRSQYQQPTQANSFFKHSVSHQVTPKDQTAPNKPFHEVVRVPSQAAQEFAMVCSFGVKSNLRHQKTDTQPLQQSANPNPTLHNSSDTQFEQNEQTHPTFNSNHLQSQQSSIHLPLAQPQQSSSSNQTQTVPATSPQFFNMSKNPCNQTATLQTTSLQTADKSRNLEIQTKAGNTAQAQQKAIATPRLPVHNPYKTFQQLPSSTSSQPNPINGLKNSSSQTPVQQQLVRNVNSDKTCKSVVTQQQVSGRPARSGEAVRLGSQQPTDHRLPQPFNLQHFADTPTTQFNNNCSDQHHLARQKTEMQETIVNANSNDRLKIVQACERKLQQFNLESESQFSRLLALGNNHNDHDRSMPNSSLTNEEKTAQSRKQVQECMRQQSTDEPRNYEAGVLKSAAATGVVFPSYFEMPLQSPPSQTHSQRMQENNNRATPYLGNPDEGKKIQTDTSAQGSKLLTNQSKETAIDDDWERKKSDNDNTSSTPFAKQTSKLNTTQNDQTKKSNSVTTSENFRDKINHLKDALTNIKTNLSSIKLTPSIKKLPETDKNVDQKELSVMNFPVSITPTHKQKMTGFQNTESLRRDKEISKNSKESPKIAQTTSGMCAELKSQNQNKDQKGFDNDDQQQSKELLPKVSLKDNKSGDGTRVTISRQSRNSQRSFLSQTVSDQSKYKRNPRLQANQSQLTMQPMKNGNISGVKSRDQSAESQRSERLKSILRKSKTTAEFNLNDKHEHLQQHTRNNSPNGVQNGENTGNFVQHGTSIHLGEPQKLKQNVHMQSQLVSHEEEMSDLLRRHRKNQTSEQLHQNQLQKKFYQLLSHDPANFSPRDGTDNFEKDLLLDFRKKLDYEAKSHTLDTGRNQNEPKSSQYLILKEAASSYLGQSCPDCIDKASHQTGSQTSRNSSYQRKQCSLQQQRARGLGEENGRSVSNPLIVPYQQSSKQLLVQVGETTTNDAYHDIQQDGAHHSRGSRSSSSLASLLNLNHLQKVELLSDGGQPPHQSQKILRAQKVGKIAHLNPHTENLIQKLRDKIIDLDMSKRRIENSVFLTKKLQLEAEGKLKVVQQEKDAIYEQYQLVLEEVERKQAKIAKLERRQSDQPRKMKEDMEQIKREKEAMETRLSCLQDMLLKEQMKVVDLQRNAGKEVDISNYINETNTLVSTQEKEQNLMIVQDLIKMLGLGKYQSNKVDFLREAINRKVKKMQKFCQKVSKIVSDVEGRKIESLSDSLKWIKGLLSDFITVREQLSAQQKMLFQNNTPYIRDKDNLNQNPPQASFHSCLPQSTFSPMHISRSQPDLSKFKEINPSLNIGGISQHRPPYQGHLSPQNTYNNPLSNASKSGNTSLIQTNKLNNMMNASQPYADYGQTITTTGTLNVGHGHPQETTLDSASSYFQRNATQQQSTKQGTTIPIDQTLNNRNSKPTRGNNNNNNTGGIDIYHNREYNQRDDNDSAMFGDQMMMIQQKSQQNKFGKNDHINVRRDSHGEDGRRGGQLDHVARQKKTSKVEQQELSRTGLLSPQSRGSPTNSRKEVNKKRLVNGGHNKYSEGGSSFCSGVPPLKKGKMKKLQSLKRNGNRVGMKSNRGESGIGLRDGDRRVEDGSIHGHVIDMFNQEVDCGELEQSRVNDNILSHRQKIDLSANNKMLSINNDAQHSERYFEKQVVFTDNHRKKTNRDNKENNKGNKSWLDRENGSGNHNQKFWVDFKQSK